VSSRFFIERPVFSMVVSILIVLAGLVSLTNLPIARFPEIVPPSVELRATYPGANAETVAQSVAGPIEQQLSGARNMIYYGSQSANDGTTTITATFEIGSNQDLAAVDVQNRLAIAQPRLPQDVTRQGIPITKTSTNMVCVVALKSTDGSMDDVQLANYATINVLDALKRIPGAGDVQVFGAKDYAMRIWVDPDRLTERNLTVGDIAGVVREQNAIFAAGRIGQRPTGEPTELTIPVLTQGRLSEPEDYENIIIRANPDGTILRLKDVARAELGSQSYDLFGRLDGKPTTLVIVYLQTGANAVDLFNNVKKTMGDLQTGFPQGVVWEIPYETVSFITVSIEEVIKTLIEAIILVLVVVFFFLQSWRATLIPLLAVPVSIIGTLAGMLVLGFSINTLTLFGLVLAIGIVVDDAIVVVENVERIMHDEHLSPRDATIKAMSQVSGPIVAIVLVLSAVFLPVAFLGGLTGELYRQFAVTIAVSVTISGIVALTLSPALCRLLLRPPNPKGPGKVERIFRTIFFGWFNWLIDVMTRGYTGAVRASIRMMIVTVLIFGGLCFVTFGLFQRIPGGFIPDEDQGYIIAVTQLPDGASLDRTDAVVRDVEEHFLADPQVDHTVTLGGLDLFSGRINSTAAAVTFARLKPWSERMGEGQHARDVIARAWQKFGGRTDAMVITVNPPSIQGLGQRAGFEMQLQARGGQDVRDLAKVADEFIAKARENPKLTGLTSTLRVTQPQLYVDLDRERARTAGVPIDRVFEALQANLGQLYVNDFDKFGRVWRVQIQAEPRFRRSPDDVGNIYVRNTSGNMVQLSGLLTVHNQSGPNVVSRFNGFPSVQITGAPGPGSSTGESIQILEELAQTDLPAGYGIAWSGASFQELKAGNAAPMVIAFGLIVVFLVLAAQYESFTLPVAVLLSVPIGILGALAAIYLRGLSRDIYFQVGLLTLIGLAAKNAILIVEFAAQQRREGKSLRDAAIEAARLRLRPILMTSLAFILGVLPLVIAEGAGASGRHSIGTGIMGGMIFATVLGIFFVPAFFVMVQWVSEQVSPATRPPTPAQGHAAGAAPSPAMHSPDA